MHCGKRQVKNDVYGKTGGRLLREKTSIIRRKMILIPGKTIVIPGKIHKGKKRKEKKNKEKERRIFLSRIEWNCNLLGYSFMHPKIYDTR